jgi:hypothetical protein
LVSKKFSLGFCGKLQDPGIKKKSKTLAMVDEYNNNPWDELEEIFSKLEAQVIDISCNMAILMVALENKFGPFKEFGSSNLEDWIR